MRSLFTGTTCPGSNNDGGGRDCKLLSQSTEATPYQAVREAVTEAEAGKNKRQVTRKMPEVRSRTFRCSGRGPLAASYEPVQSRLVQATKLQKKK
jgi:hypothetical protein